MDRVKIVKWTALVVLVACILYVVWQWSHWRALGEAGSAYAARITCSCRYVQERSAQSCERDVEEDGSLVSLTELPDEKAIIGSVPLLGRAKAQFRPGYGCVMQPE